MNLSRNVIKTVFILFLILALLWIITAASCLRSQQEGWQYEGTLIPGSIIHWKAFNYIVNPSPSLAATNLEPMRIEAKSYRFGMRRGGQVSVALFIKSTTSTKWRTSAAEAGKILLNEAVESPSQHQFPHDRPPVVERSFSIEADYSMSLVLQLNDYGGLEIGLDEIIAFNYWPFHAPFYWPHSVPPGGSQTKRENDLIEERKKDAKIGNEGRTEITRKGKPWLGRRSPKLFADLQGLESDLFYACMPSIGCGKSCDDLPRDQDGSCEGVFGFGSSKAAIARSDVLHGPLYDPPGRGTIFWTVLVASKSRNESVPKEESGFHNRRWIAITQGWPTAVVRTESEASVAAVLPIVSVKLQNFGNGMINDSGKRLAISQDEAVVLVFSPDVPGIVTINSNTNQVRIAGVPKSVHINGKEISPLRLER